ncbi:hypothetical protein EDD86DRAFT_205912 [Gorgonomyces haynaldii]|nr:hypothetical protein EDD86DRAFT_205912 [Gorgonomyces haynaldii]
MAANDVSKAFVDFYYNTFDRNRSDLSPLYKDHSTLSFEGQHFQGTQAIIEKLTALPFQKVAHQVVTVDSQFSTPQVPGPILVTVTGRLLVDEETNPMNFTQTFHLVPEGNTFYVYNDIFRLNYGF